MYFPRLGLALVLGVASSFLALQAASAKDFQYECEDGTELTATFSPPEQAHGVADLVFADGKKVALPQAVSADGGRYTKDDIEFWIKGSSATLTIAGKTTNCETAD
ncbi:MliC family protein [Kaistia nematophila]|uniref:MliC family protein n=1 Tax=Kaistia nematophila TaxID=2994654 RepID=A0A9X3IM40_9HYPH|nr:MliC family protein [Kaistia nematophila]MCX5570527.1 MliC family protein [Kaistia nematophila]